MTTTSTDKPYARYLGDGVYIDYDGYALLLTTSDGERVTNRIAIEPAVWEALSKYVQWLTKRLQAGGLVTEAPTPPPDTSVVGEPAALARAIERIAHFERELKAIKQHLGIKIIEIDGRLVTAMWTPGDAI